MKKTSRLFAIFALYIPLWGLVLYSQGLCYYSSYLRALGISYGLFNLDLNQLLFFGNMALIITSYAFLISLALSIFYLLMLYLILDKLLKPRIKDKIRSMSKTSFQLHQSKTFNYLVELAVPITSIIAVIVMSFYVIAILNIIATKHGLTAGTEAKKDYSALFFKANSKHDISDENLLVLTLNHGTIKKIGYLIASNDNWLAIYANTNKTEIFKVSEIDSMESIESLQTYKKILHQFPERIYPLK